MTTTAAILLIISAFTHAGWNFISKKENPTQAFYLVANTIGVICIMPILLYYWGLIHFVPTSVWIIVVLSGFFLAAYLEAMFGMAFLKEPRYLPKIIGITAIFVGLVWVGLK